MEVIIRKEKYEITSTEQDVPKKKKDRNKLHKSSKDSMIFGVCGGLAEYLDVDSACIRILFALLLFLVDATNLILLYILLVIILPKK